MAEETDQFNDLPDKLVVRLDSSDFESRTDLNLKWDVQVPLTVDIIPDMLALKKSVEDEVKNKIKVSVELDQVVVAIKSFNQREIVLSKNTKLDELIIQKSWESLTEENRRDIVSQFPKLHPIYSCTLGASMSVITSDGYLILFLRHDDLIKYESVWSSGVPKGFNFSDIKVHSDPNGPLYQLLESQSYLGLDQYLNLKEEHVDSIKFHHFALKVAKYEVVMLGSIQLNINKSQVESYKMNPQFEWKNKEIRYLKRGNDVVDFIDEVGVQNIVPSTLGALKMFQDGEFVRIRE